MNTPIKTCIFREKVHIEVEDVNEYEPKWGKDTYMVDVVERKLYDNILQLEVDDEDGSDDFSQICHFHILTPDAPFTIDQEGEFLRWFVI